MKKAYLLDTNIVSEFSKARPNENVLQLYGMRKNLCAISSITWQELVHGVSKMEDGRRKEIISNFIQNLKNNMEIIPYDEFSAKICGEIFSMGEKNGTVHPYSDTQIAATAIANGMVLVTRNVADFKSIAQNSFLQVENWFES